MDRLNTRNILKRKNYKIEGNNYNLYPLQPQQGGNSLPPVLCLDIQSTVLATLGNALEPKHRFLPHDGGCKRSNSTPVFHGDIHYCNMGNLETEKQSNLQEKKAQLPKLEINVSTARTVTGKQNETTKQTKFLRHNRHVQLIIWPSFLLSKAFSFGLLLSFREMYRDWAPFLCFVYIY